MQNQLDDRLTKHIQIHREHGKARTVEFYAEGFSFGVLAAEAIWRHKIASDDRLRRAILLAEVQPKAFAKTIGSNPKIEKAYQAFLDVAVKEIDEMYTPVEGND